MSVEDAWRSNARSLLIQSLQRGGVKNDRRRGLAADIEEAVHDAAKGDNIVYSELYSQVGAALAKPYGEFCDDTLAGYVATGRIAPGALNDQAVYSSWRDIEGPSMKDPRRRIRGQFYAILGGSRLEDAVRRDYARRLESSCYTAAITRCQLSEQAYRRLWTSPNFVAVYNSRAGVVLSNLDPGGSVAAQFGPGALDRLVAGALDPDTVGGLEAVELCPQASEQVRDEIALRSRQTIEAKASSLYQCPRCRSRSHTVPDTGIQMRSGDEGTNIRLTCLVCGFRFEAHG